MSKKVLDLLNAYQDLDPEIVNSIELDIKKAYNKGLNQAPILNIKGKFPKFPEFNNAQALRYFIFTISFPFTILPLLFALLFGLIPICIVNLISWAVYFDKLHPSVTYNTWYGYDPLTKFILVKFAGYDKKGDYQKVLR